MDTTVGQIGGEVVALRTQTDVSVDAKRNETPLSVCPQPQHHHLFAPHSFERRKSARFKRHQAQGGLRTLLRAGCVVMYVGVRTRGVRSPTTASSRSGENTSTLSNKRYVFTVARSTHEIHVWKFVCVHYCAVFNHCSTAALPFSTKVKDIATTKLDAL